MLQNCSDEQISLLFVTWILGPPYAGYQTNSITPPVFINDIFSWNFFSKISMGNRSKFVVKFSVGQKFQWHEPLSLWFPLKGSSSIRNKILETQLNNTGVQFWSGKPAIKSIIPYQERHWFSWFTGWTEKPYFLAVKHNSRKFLSIIILKITSH